MHSRYKSEERRAISAVIDYVELEDINKCRRLNGLPEIKVREIECCRCHRKFETLNRYKYCSECHTYISNMAEWGQEYETSSKGIGKEGFKKH